MAKCPPIDELVTALAEASPRPEILAHLEECTRCSRRAEQIRRDEAFFDEAVEAASSHGSSSTSSAQRRSKDGTAGRPPADIDGYEILVEIHHGGQGVVYKAIQKAAKREVALKVLHGGALATARQQRRFEREIETMAALRHPNIVTIYDTGVTSEGLQYFAMEHIRGLALDQYLKASGIGERRLRVAEYLDLFCKIADALGYAHQRGVIHRDLKPANIIVDDTGQPHVVDFGLTKTIGDTEMTLTGEFMGTLRYAAPEQVKGDPDLIDSRTDVYALGVVLYEMLTEHPPYDVGGSVHQLIQNIVNSTPVRPSALKREINDEVETIVLKALAKDPARRYQSAGALSADVRCYLAGEAIEAKRDSAWYVLKKAARRYRLPVSVTAAIGLLITAFAIAMTVLARRAVLAEARTAEALRYSTVEQARALAAAGNIPAAEELLWPALFRAAGEAETDDVDEMLRTFAAFRHAWWGLWGTYAAHPCLKTWQPRSSGKGMAISSDGRLLACGEPDGSITVCDAPDGAVRATLARQQSDVGPLCFLLDGRTLAARYLDGTVRLWSVQEGTCLWTADTDSTATSALACDARDDRLACGTDYGVQVRNAATGSVIAELGGHQSPVTWVAFSHDRRWLASFSSEVTIVRDTESWEVAALLPYDGARQFVTNGCWLPDGRLLVVTDWHLSAYSPGTWQLAGASESHEWAVPANPHTPADEGWIVTASNDKSVGVFRGADLTTIGFFRGHAKGLSGAIADPGGRWLISQDAGGVMKLWEPQPPSAFRELPLDLESVHALSWTSDGHRLAYGGGPQTIMRIASAASGETVRDLVGHTTAVVSRTALAPDGRIMATAGYDATVRLWSIENGDCLGVMQGHEGRVNDVAFSPDGRYLASASDDRTARLWDVRTGKVRHVLSHHSDRVAAVAFAGGGLWVVTCGRDGLVALWNASTGGLASILEDRAVPVRVLAPSPDGRMVAVGADDAELHLWDLESQTCVESLTGHSSDVFCAAFSPDGRLLASGSLDGEIQLWDVQTRRPLLSTRVKPELHMIFSMAFSPDSRTLAVGGSRHTLALLDLHLCDRHIAGNATFRARQITHDEQARRGADRLVKWAAHRAWPPGVAQQ